MAEQDFGVVEQVDPFTVEMRHGDVNPSWPHFDGADWPHLESR
jgi:hypothetical protein